MKYRRKGDYDHRAVVIEERVLYWPTTGKEEPCYIVDFEGGRNGKGVVIPKAEFDPFYEVVDG
jgi:hypothetical protein